MNLPVTIADLQALLATYQEKMTASMQGGPKDTAAYNEARDALVAALRQIAAYIQSLALDNESDILTSGFDIVVRNNTQSPLTMPRLIGLDNSVSMRLQVKLYAVDNAKAYQLQYRNGEAAWLEGGIFANTRGIILANLVPGTIYTARLRAIGGSTNYSDWSPSISLMAT